MSTYQSAMKKGEEKIDCPFCEGVECFRSCNQCDKCGWNPDVAAAKLNKIKEKLESEN